MPSPRKRGGGFTKTEGLQETPSFNNSAARLALSASSSLATLDRKHGPVLPFAEKTPSRNLEDVLSFPEHDAQLDPEAVSEPGPRFQRIDEVDDHVDPLLFDPEGRYLHKPRWLDAPR